jgi:hypothetical protein
MYPSRQPASHKTPALKLETAGSGSIGHVSELMRPPLIIRGGDRAHNTHIAMAR